MDDNDTPGIISAIPGPALTFVGAPFADAADTCMTYLPAALLVMSGGAIRKFGPAEDILPTLGSAVAVERYPDSPILPGFIDSHIHYP